MPPLPSTLDEETTNLVESIQRREQDLTSFQIPRLRSCKGPLAVQQRYADELREALDELSGQVDVRLIFV